MLPVHILSTSSVFASAFSQFAPAAAAFSFSACAFASSLSACAAAFFCGGVFFFFFEIKKIFFDDLLVSFSSSGFSTPMLFSCFGRFFHALSCRVFLFQYSCTGYVFPGMVIVKVAMTQLWSLPMWIMSLASASLLYLKYLLLVNM